jgi:hypothetical protein
MGARSGVPDLLIICAGKALLIEIKTEKGRLSEAQMACHAEIMAAGGRVAVIRSLDDLREVLAFWEIPVRETKPSTERIRRGFQAEFRPFEREGIAMKDWPESDQVGRRRRKT